MAYYNWDRKEWYRIINLQRKIDLTFGKSQLGFIFQSNNLLHLHTAFESVEFPLLLLVSEEDGAFPGKGGIRFRIKEPSFRKPEKFRSL